MLDIGKRALALAFTAGLVCNASAQAPPPEREGLLIWSSHDGIVHERNEFAPSPKTESSLRVIDQRLPSIDSKRLLVCEPRSHN
jgi:hypothetical protein